ncbi:endonuclease/exonuclease/phosphatase family protein [Gemmatimonas aurantiaca]|nr:endonuclease/exonuclease/phosphatase family protein [Gemmatimonas aurantiaca]
MRSRGSGSRFPRLARVVTWTCWGWLAATVAIWIGLYTLSERTLPFTMLLYGPRWVVLLPLAILVPVALIFAWRALLPLALSAVIAAVPIMGFRLSPAGLMAGRTPPLQVAPNGLRILSLNAQGGGVVQQHLDEMMAAYTPSVMAFQECGRELGQNLAKRAEWHFEQFHNLCLLSRWPVTQRDSMPRAAFARISDLGYGGAAIVIRYTIAHPAGPFELVNLHLETARKGLEGILGDQGLLRDDTGLPNVPASLETDRFAINADIRLRESERASYWSARHANTTPIVVVGDFNMPVESSIFRAYWSALSSAFDAGGRGFGFTKHEGRWLRIRIDHVLFAPQWFETSGAWVGNDVGSDHRPVIADLTRKR